MAKEVRRLQTLSFFDTVGPSSIMTLTSKRIEVPFNIKEITASFAPGVNRLMRLEFYFSPDDSTPTSKPITGTNILATLGHVGYLTGDDERKSQSVEVETVSAGYYVKVLAENGDTFPHTVDAQVLVELIYIEEEVKE